jgi:hypothetical protein
MRVEFSSAFPWGLLLARDSESAESIGPWADSAEVVTSCSTALVVRVQHEQEGDVAVTVMTAEKPPAAIPVFDGALHLGSGVLRVGDALGETTVDVSVAPGVHRVRVLVDAPQSATHVFVLLDE